jgi:hypothetical protein
MAKKKKFRLKSFPETQNLLIIVMEIEAAQYVRMEMIGLFVIDDGPYCLFLSSIVVRRSQESDTRGILQCGRVNMGMRLRFL